MEVQKWGKKNGLQEYKCKNCHHRFRNKRRKNKEKHNVKLYEKYALNQRTLDDLALENGVTIKTFQKILDGIIPYTGELRSVENKSVIICMDATNITNVGVLTLLRNTKQENLLWKWSTYETNINYLDCLTDLDALGYSFQSFVIDGRAGLKKQLQEQYPNSPIQHCLFHQIKTVKKYLPRNVQSKAGKALRAIGLNLTNYNYIQFVTALNVWLALHNDYMNEKTYNNNPFNKRKWWYTHRRLRSAYFSLKRNMPYLFTYQKYTHLKIPNTTNICEGYFSHLKDRLNRHRGLSSSRKLKMANYLLSIKLPSE